MARKWEITPHQYAWNFEQCEELVLIAGYEEIRAKIAVGSGWVVDFEGHFFQHGNGIAFLYVDEINAVRRRCVLPKLDFKETDVFEYGRSSNKLMKSERRQRARADYLAASTDERLRLLAHATSEMRNLPTPHMPYEDYMANKRRLSAEADHSRDLVRSRLRSHALPPPAAANSPSLAVEKAARMLKYATDADLRSRIIGHLSSEDALALVDQIEDAELRNALIGHSLALELHAPAARPMP